MNLGKIIKDYRDKHNLSQRDFAKRCGLSYTYIAMLEKGTDYRSEKPISPTLDAINKVAKGLQITLDELLTSLGDESVNLSYYNDNKVYLDKTMFPILRLCQSRL